MAQYVFIQNYTRNGTMGISHNVFDQIAEIATNAVEGATVSSQKKLGTFSLHKPITCSIRNGLVDVKIYVIIAARVNVKEVCLKIQENVANSLSMMTELIPFKILVEVAAVDTVERK